MVLFLRRAVADRTLLVTLLALSALFATLTVPLVLARESLTIAWSLLALMFLWLGGRIHSAFLRHLGHALYVIVFGRMSLELSTRFEGASPPGTFAAYGRVMLDRLWTFGVSIGSVLTAFYLERNYAKNQPAPAPSAVTSGSVARGVFYWFALLFIFAYLQCETYRALNFFVPLRQPALTLLWVAMAAYFLRRYLREPRAYLLTVLAIFLLVAIGKTLTIDLWSWHLRERWFFGGEYRALGVGLRWLDFGGTLALLAAGWHLFGQASSRHLQRVFGYGGLALLFLFTTLEARSFLHALLPAFLDGGTSVLWALFAVAFLVGGIRRQVKPLRFAGLGLFLIVVAKVFLVDLAGMPTLYRVIAFLVLGLFLLAGAFAYMRASATFNQEHPS